MRGLRIGAAAVVGGVIVFMWGAFSHMVLPIGEMGVRSLPSEDVLVPAMKGAIAEPGFYMFPGMGEHPDEAELKVWEEKYRAGPRGVVIYHPTGQEVMSPAQLGTELGSNVAAALIAACVIAGVGGPFGRRALVGLGMGVFAWFSVDVSYYNWYGFPLEMALSGLLDQAVGWLMAGAAMAGIVGRGRVATRDAKAEGRLA